MDKFNIVDLLVTAIGGLTVANVAQWYASQKERKEHLRDLRRKAETRENTISDLENRLAELEDD